MAAALAPVGGISQRSALQSLSTPALGTPAPLVSGKVASAPNISATKDKEDSEEKKKAKKKSKPIGMCTINSKYPVVRRVARRQGFREFEEDEDWCLFWTDTAVGLEQVIKMKKFQKVNHFPRMSEICRKDLLCRNLNRMRKAFPDDYTFFPATWLLPADFGDLQLYARDNPKAATAYIVKPASSCQGKGISIVKDVQKIKPGQHVVVQEYLGRPLLLDGFKFDLRIYVLVTSCDPFRIYINRDGLVRLATLPYEKPTSKNMGQMNRHLTNYAVNKASDTFVRGEDTNSNEGTKRKISAVFRALAEQGRDIDKLWREIDDAAIKTILSIDTVLRHNYRACFPYHTNGSGCFEILGFDVILERDLRPVVLEVNHSPSFTCDSLLDREIKEAVIGDAIAMLDMHAEDPQRWRAEETKRMHQRLMPSHTAPAPSDEASRNAATLAFETKCCETNSYRRIYPPEGPHNPYQRFLDSQPPIFAATATSKARLAAALALRDEIRNKTSKRLGPTVRPSSASRNVPPRPLYRTGLSPAQADDDGEVSDVSEPDESEGAVDPDPIFQLDGEADVDASDEMLAGRLSCIAEVDESARSGAASRVPGSPSLARPTLYPQAPPSVVATQFAAATAAASGPALSSTSHLVLGPPMLAAASTIPMPPAGPRTAPRRPSASSVSSSGSTASAASASSPGRTFYVERVLGELQLGDATDATAGTVSAAALIEADSRTRSAPVRARAAMASTTRARTALPIARVSLEPLSPISAGTQLQPDFSDIDPRSQTKRRSVTLMQPSVFSLRPPVGPRP